MATLRLFAAAREAAGTGRAEVEGATGCYYEKNRLVPPSTLAQNDAVGDRLVEESRKLVRL